jgi:hypothetical protein
MRVAPFVLPLKQNVANALNPLKYDVEIVHRGNDKSRLKEAESAGAKSVPAIVMDGAVFRIRFGAGIEALE